MEKKRKYYSPEYKAEALKLALKFTHFLMLIMHDKPALT